MERVIVVGGGAIGAFAAVALRRAGCAVVLVDRGNPAMIGSAGILARCAMIPTMNPQMIRRLPAYLLARDSPLFLKDRLRLAGFFAAFLGGARRYRQTSALLAPLVVDAPARHLAFVRGTAAAAFIQSGDYVYLYRSEAAFAAAAFEREIRAGFGVGGEKMSRADLADFDPNLSAEMQVGWRMNDHGWITDPPRYLDAVIADFAAAGGEVMRAAARALRPTNDGITVELEDGRALRGDVAVAACGADSPALLAPLGCRPPFAAERGYNAEFFGASIAPPCPYMIDDAKLVATPMAGRLRVAGLAEFAADPAAPPTAAAGDFIVRQMRRVFPGLQSTDVRRWVGARPTVADSLPLIGGVAGGRVVVAVGHQHIGLTAAPATALMIADLICKGKRPPPAFAPDRFT